MIALVTLNQGARAQDFEDAIESEIDSLSQSGVEADFGAQPPQAAPSPTPKPGAAARIRTSDQVEPLFEETPVKDEISDSDLEPLESPFEPAAKASKASKTKPVTSAPSVSASPESEELESPSIDTGVAVAPGSDEPNAQFEARLAKIYSEHGEPVSDEKWTTLLGTRAAETYSVQAGDTLWDLSSTLFADGFYWSRLWAENPEIQNPHRIAKGQAVRFIGGTEAAPPEIRVVQDQPDPLIEQSNAAFDREDIVQAVQDLPPAEDKSDIDTEVPLARSGKVEGKPLIGEAPVFLEDMEGRITQADLEAGVIIEQNELVRRPRIPPSDVDRRPVLREIPPSFAEKRPRLPDRTVTIQRRSSAAERVAAALVPTYIGFERRPEPIASVVEAEAGEYVASIGQTILVEANEPLAIGTNFYTVTERYSVSGGGYAYEVGGVVRLTELLDEKKQLYRGQIIYAVGPVRVGSDVLAGEIPRVAISTKGRRVNSKLVVAGGGEDSDRNLFGDGAVLLLRSEREEEVQVGDVLAIQGRIGERRKNTKIPDVSGPIGVVKVFAVSGKLVSAYVILATSEIRKGDYTGPTFPTRLPDLVHEVPRVSRGPSD